MPSHADSQKPSLRRRLRQQLAEMSHACRLEQSFGLCARLREQVAWRGAKSVLLFSPLPDEPDISPLLAEALAEGKTVHLPRFLDAHGHYEIARIRDLGSDLRPGQYGIPEPSPHCPTAVLNPLDLILVPGIAFDRRGHRLGRGRGHYDRLLAQATAYKCGAAFDLQVVDEVPHEPHDIRLDSVVTPTRWIAAASNRPH